MFVQGRPKTFRCSLLFLGFSLLLLTQGLFFPLSAEESKIKHLKTISLNSGRRYSQILGLAALEKKIYLLNPSGARRRGLLVYDAYTREVSRVNHTKFTRPVDIAIGEKQLYIVDAQENCVKVYDAQGKFLFSFGKSGSGKGEFRRPYGIALNPRRKWVYVVDVGNTRVEVFDLEGNYLFEFKNLSRPQNIAVDREGKVYVVEPLACEIKIFDATGTKLIKKFGDDLLFARPMGIAVDSKLNIYVVDTVLNGIQVFDPRGIPLFLFGKKGNLDGEFSSPSGIYIDENDLLYVADTNNERIQIFEILK